MFPRSEIEKRFVTAVGLLSGLCLGLLALRVISTGSLRYGFIPNNLALSWLGLIFALLLRQHLKVRRWKSWQNLGLTALWLIFLPNSWYVLTDLIHVQPSGEVSQLYDIVLVSSLIICGYLLGFASLYLVHRQLLKRLRHNRAWILVEMIILLSSFAIYLGRNLRWNTWDIIINPSGIILNITDRLINPLGHRVAFSVTGLFFVMLSVLYLAFWIFVQPLSKSRRP